MGFACSYIIYGKLTKKKYFKHIKTDYKKNSMNIIKITNNLNKKMYFL